MTDTTPDTDLDDDPSTGALDLSDRAALRRVGNLSTELTDVTEVEYRQLRLERVVLAGLSTSRDPHEAEVSMAELAALAETAGSQVLDAVIQPRDKPDAATFLGSGKAAELRDIVAETGFRRSELLIELTESTEVRDTALLRRALERLGRADFRVLLDDLGLDDARRVLLDLPFAGVKLDRSLVACLPAERRARGLVERLARQARRRGGAVIAEGVTDPLLWRLTSSTGCNLAQGFGVGRPLPPEALPAWIAAWSGAALPEPQPE